MTNTWCVFCFDVPFTMEIPDCHKTICSGDPVGALANHKSCELQMYSHTRKNGKEGRRAWKEHCGSCSQTETWFLVDHCNLEETRESLSRDVQSYNVISKANSPGALYCLDEAQKPPKPPISHSLVLQQETQSWQWLWGKWAHRTLGKLLCLSHMTVLLSLSLKLLLSAITDFTISSARTPEFATEEARRRVSLFHTELVTLIPLHSYTLRGKLNRAPTPTFSTD